jgi:hypothetical protein
MKDALLLFEVLILYARLIHLGTIGISKPASLTRQTKEDTGAPSTA